MKLQITFVLITIYFVLPGDTSFGQIVEKKEYPVIGEQIPDFTLTDVQYFKMPVASRANLKGKPIILDFFAIGCSACFASFPKTNELNREFKDQVNIILVGREHEKIRTVYEGYRKRQKLDLPVTYENELLDRWEVFGVPRVVWIDAEGTVRAVTDTRQMDAENIRALIEGKPFTFKIDYSHKESLTIFEKALLIGGNGGNDSDFSFRSILYPWNPSTEQKIPMSIGSLLNDPEIRKSLNMNFYGFQCTGASLWQLYAIAYLGHESYRDQTGNWYNAPILELSDPSKFQHDFSTGKNVYNYSIIVPEEIGSARYIQKIMQQDLERYLGFSASLEKRIAPYWRLTATELAKKRLKTTHAKVDPKIEGGYEGKKYLNVPIGVISGALNGLDSNGLAVVDETGINFNIDIEIEANMTNREEVWKALEKNGLLLEKAEKVMTVMVIRDTMMVFK